VIERQRVIEQRRVIELPRVIERRRVIEPVEITYASGDRACRDHFLVSTGSTSRVVSTGSTSRAGSTSRGRTCEDAY
jgi:hypothetical protein